MRFLNKAEVQLRFGEDMDVAASGLAAIHPSDSHPQPLQPMKSATRRLTALLSFTMLAAGSAMAQQPPAMPAGPQSGSPQSAASAEGKPPGMLGVEVERISEELRYQLPLIKPGAGLIVRGLVPGGPAALAQVGKLDILLQWNDHLLVHPAQLQVLAQSATAGDQVDLADLHHGVFTHAHVTLAASAAAPAKPGGRHLSAAGAGGAPLAELGALLGSDAVRQAADALAHSGIDANAVANMLKGADLGKLDPAKLDPAALLGGKIALVAPDGSRHEINLGDLMRSNGNIGELLKGLDLGKSDPAALLGSKIFLIGPDGRQTEIDLAPMLKSAGAIGGLLKGFGPPPGH